MTILSWTTALGVGRFGGEVTLWWEWEFIFIIAVCGLIRRVHVLLPPAVAQEFGLSQTASAASGSQQPQQASSTVHILSLLLRLRQCCCHLSLLKKVHWWSSSHCSRHVLSLSVFTSAPQTLDSSELNGDGIVLSLEEQLNALSLTSTPPQSGPKDTVALNGTQFPSELFEETSESTKVGSRQWLAPLISPEQENKPTQEAEY